MAENRTYDEAVEEAWRAFRSALADYLADLDSPGVLRLRPATSRSDDEFPSTLLYLIALKDAELMARVPPGQSLSPDDRLSESDIARLIDLGWTASESTASDQEAPADNDSPAYILRLPSRQADEIAVAAVNALRKIWNVPHPSFLAASTFRHPVTLGPSLAQAMAHVPDEIDLDRAIVPSDGKELDALVWDVVSELLERAPDFDDDGDIVLTVHGQTVYVLTPPSQPVVRLWAPVLFGIAGRTRAAELVADLTARQSDVRLLLLKDELYAELEVPAMPFVPRHLLEALTKMSRFLSKTDDEFARRFHGELYGNPSDESDIAASPDSADGQQADATPDAGRQDEPEAGLPRQLLTILLLDPDGSAELTADEVARICDHDRDTILAYITIAEEQMIAWQDSADEARRACDRQEFEACEHEFHAWQKTVGALRGALRLVVLPQAARPPEPRQEALFDAPSEPTLFDEPER